VSSPSVGEGPFAMSDLVEEGPSSEVENHPNPDDPYALMAAARRQAPVQAKSPFGETSIGSGATHVLGYEEVVAVLRDHETFSSALLNDSLGPLFGNTLVAMDEPGHRIQRALVAPAFRPRLLGHWQGPFIRDVVDELIDSFIEHGQADLVGELTFAFPAQVIARILGLPASDMPQFQRWADDLINIFIDLERGTVALAEFHDYFHSLVAERRAAPKEDLISALVTSEVDGQRLDDEEVFGFIRLLLPAGIETTYRSLGNLLVALLTHPQQLAAITENPDLRTAAIEEGLRWETPFLLLVRQSSCDTELAGIAVPRNQFVCAYVSSANHDERRYDHPEDFDVGRSSVGHVAFGSGIHACLGMHLTRLETRAALDGILKRLPSLRLDPDAPIPRIRTTAVFRSPDAVPVRFEAGQRRSR
jgi:cytochrome P450